MATSPQIEWAISTVYAIWHARKVFPDGSTVSLCQMRYEIHRTENELPVGATVCSMCAAGISKSYEHALAILGRVEDGMEKNRDRESLTPQESEIWKTVRDTLGRS